MKRIISIFYIAYLSISFVYGQNNTSSDNPSKNIKLMSYNILHVTSTKKNMEWSGRKDGIIKILKKYNPDILCAQEDQFLAGEYIIQQTGLTKVGVNYHGTTEGMGTYRAIYYNAHRFALKNKGHFWLSETPDVRSKGWDAKSVRMCNWALFLDNQTNLEFYVFNAHFDHLGRQAALNSASLVLEKIEEITHGKPVVFAGDLNSTPDSPPILKLKTLLFSAHENSVIVAKGPQGTFGGNTGSIPIKRIDHIFVRNFKTHEFITIDDRRDNGVHASDHCPIMATLIQQE